MRTVDPTALRDAMRGVRALLLDLDGVIVVAGAAVPGSVEAIAELERRGTPYRIVTNTSLVSRATLSRYAARLGNDIPPERFQSALSASAAFAARTFPDAPLYVIASADAMTESPERLPRSRSSNRSSGSASTSTASSTGVPSWCRHTWNGR